MDSLTIRLKQYQKALNTAIWFYPILGRWNILRAFLWLLRIHLLTIRGFRKNLLLLHAASLSFFTLLSVVPLLAMLFLILKWFRVADLVKPYLLTILASGNAKLVEQISVYIENTRSAGLGWVGIAGLFILGFVLLQRVKATFNLIWEVEFRPGYGYRFIEYIAVLFISPLLMVGSFSVSTFLRGIRISESFQGWQGINDLTLAAANLSGFLVFWLLSFYAFAFLPDIRVKWLPAALGALASGSALKLSQGVYIYLMFQVPHYNLIYGALAMLPFLMIWFYVAGIIFLLGAQLTCSIQNYSVLLDQIRFRNDPGTTTPYAALTTLAGLLMNMKKTGKAASLNQFIKSTGLSQGVVEESVSRLINSGLITPVLNEKNTFVPREALEKLTLVEVLKRLALLPGFATPPLAWQQNGGSALQKIFQRSNQALTQPLENITIGDMISLLEKEEDSIAPPQKKKAPRKAGKKKE